MNSCFDILVIEPTKDEKKIKQAYAKKLKKCDKNDILLQQELHDAFNLARELIDKIDEQEIQDNTISQIQIHKDIELSKILNTEDPSTIKDFFEQFRKLPLDKEVEYNRYLIWYVTDNIRYISQYAINQMIEHLQYIDTYEYDSIYLNDEVYKVRMIQHTIQYRTFNNYNNPLFSKYIEYRESIILSMLNKNFEEVQEILKLSIFDDGKWNDEIELLKIVFEILSKPLLEYKVLYQKCKELVKKHPDNQLAIACFICLMNKDMAHWKFKRQDYVIGDALYIDNQRINRVDYYQLVSIDLVQGTKIKKGISSYYEYYIKHKRNVVRDVLNKEKRVIMSFLLILVLFLFVLYGGGINISSNLNSNNSIPQKELELLLKSYTGTVMTLQSDEIISMYRINDKEEFQKYMIDKGYGFYTNRFYLYRLEFNTGEIESSYRCDQLVCSITYVDKDKICIIFEFAKEDNELNVFRDIKVIGKCKR